MQSVLIDCSYSGSLERKIVQHYEYGYDAIDRT